MDKASENSEYCDNIEEELSRIGLDCRRWDGRNRCTFP
jgi:hypothetical protein